MTLVPAPTHRRQLWIGGLVLVALAGAIVLALRHDIFQSSSGSTGLRGSGIAATQTRDLPRFSSVDLAGANEVMVVVGRKQKVVVRGDDNLLGRVSTRVEAGSLVIGNTGSFTTEAPMSVRVEIPSLAALRLSGTGTIAAERIRGKRLRLALPGTGVLRASGAVARLEISLGGAGDAQLARLVARDAHAVVTGAGRIHLTATDTLSASVPGAGAIVYGGDPPHVKTRITGTGAVTPG